MTFCDDPSHAWIRTGWAARHRRPAAALDVGRRPGAAVTAGRRVGIAVLGLGWMGQAHSRSALRLPSLFPDHAYAPALVVCADTDAGAARARRPRLRVRPGDGGLAGGGRGGRRRRGLGDGAEHAPRADDRGGLRRREGRVQREADRRQAGARGRRVPRGARRGRAPPGSATTTSGRRSCCTPGSMVAYGRLGRITHYRGRFLSMYGSDELGLLTWRFKLAEAGYGVTSDILSHSVVDGPVPPRGRDQRARRHAGDDDPAPPAADAVPPRTTAAARPRTRTATSRTRTSPRCCAGSPAVPRARSSAAGRWSAPRARTRSRSTAPRARSPGTSSGSTSCSTTGAAPRPRPAGRRSSAATASRTTVRSCPGRPTPSASRTSSRSRTTRSCRAS